MVGRAGYRAGVVLIGDLQIVLVGDRGGIAKPFANNVQGESGCQFGLSGRPQVAEQPGPGF